MLICPICGLALNTRAQLNTHLEVKHRMQWLTVKPDGDAFEMEIHREFPEGGWIQIGAFWRISDDQYFIALGQGIYAGEVDEDKLNADIAKFLGLGKRVSHDQQR